jgi:hypothetical protein
MPVPEVATSGAALKVTTRATEAVETAMVAVEVRVVKVVEASAVKVVVAAHHWLQDARVVVRGAVV